MTAHRTPHPRTTSPAPPVAPAEPIAPAEPVAPADPTDWRGWIAYGLAWADASRLHRLAQTEQRRVVEHAVPRVPSGFAAPPHLPSAPSVSARHLTLHAYTEAVPGPRWQALFEATWPAYRAWYLSEGDAARPTLAQARAQLTRHMPELVPTWERLVELTAIPLTGTSRHPDETAARLLTMWRVPIFAAGCSQIILTGPDARLVRNYDYDAQLFEGVIASTNYSGTRRVIGTSDMLWGLLDGMNDAGLSVSLTYGGRPGGGDGFAIPLVLRYLLETCDDVAAAIATLQRIPVAQAYNLALLDTRGGHATVFVAPGEAPQVSDLTASTNHRLETVEHPATAARLRSVPRQQSLLRQLADGTPSAQIVDSFTCAPLRSVDYDAGFGTLYTAEYRPAAGTVTYRWPDAVWTRRFDDADDRRTVALPA